ncbi:Frizzled and smoothened-like protein O [Talaromyces islandicus]|uniref:Frizzled and smoothened-like protein O n=1 Tax=Talaromyces islandicus TaxID=28573 RepID=A0A0U1LTA8_TALIS|nr:Frizzled and smoothened-like protein O [Talaromyces islandicus]
MSGSSKHGLCPAPFLQEALFTNTRGYINGRFCQEYGGHVCCLPCPLQDWRYPDNVDAKVGAAGWIAVALLPFSVFLLLTYAILPVKYTNRHYITVCFTLALACMQVAFIVPLGTKPDACYDEITPNDMYSDLSCAFTGALLLFGGIAVVTWSLLRTIALHLQVCWEIVIGPVFMWCATVAGLGVPILITAVMLHFTGVSYRFGGVCHINSENSLGDYWIPLLVFAGLALILQFATIGYCIHIYVRSLFDSDPTSTNHSGLPSYSGSVRTATARQAYKRVRRVLKMQWRSIALVITILANVIYFSVIFVQLNNSLNLTPETKARATPWLLCLVTYQDPTKCTAESKPVAIAEAKLVATMVLLAIVNMWNFIFTVRWSMIQGWIALFRGFLVERVEFVSVDARSRPADTSNYEMLNPRQNMKTPEPLVEVRSPSPAYGHGPKEVAFVGRDASYHRPTMSFSSPRPPSSSQNNKGYTWDATTSFARSNSQMDHRN